MKAIRFALIATIALASSAQAHWADLAAAEISTAEREVRMTLTYPTGLTAFADDNQNGRLETVEVSKHNPALRDALASKIKVSDGPESGPSEFGKLEVAAAFQDLKLPSSVNLKTHSTLMLTYSFSQSIRDAKIDYNLFVPGVSTASCLATVLQGDQIQNVVFTPENHGFSLAGESSQQSGRAAAPVDFKSFVFLGLEHILTGYDHLLFVLSLLALGGGLRYLLKVVTAFTLAHSVTLALTTLGIIALPGRIIESGIALSIAYVAAENILSRNKTRLERSRWIITFVFGLLHGMGFAGLLGEMNLSASSLPVALVGFNLGVELGQLAVVIPAFLLLRWLERWKIGSQIRWSASAFAVVAGLYWFVERAFLSA
jgi:HupE / UreJ protein